MENCNKTETKSICCFGKKYLIKQNLAKTTNCGPARVVVMNEVERMLDLQGLYSC
jgi:hypothetical protein